MDFSPYLDASLGPNVAAYKASIEAALDAYLTYPLNDRRSRLVEAMRYATLGGSKRFRGMLCMASHASLGGDAADVLPLSCAVELLHACTLVHDDLPAMDDAAIRRGRPSCHRVFGEGLAVLAGDALHALAAEVLLRDLRRSFAADAVLAVAGELLRALGIHGLAGGQALDLEGPSPRRLDDLGELHRLKTAALLSFCAVAPSLLARAPPPVTAALRRFGEQLGLLFQIADDLLDGLSSRDIGKPSGRDRILEKETYFTRCGADAASRLAEERAAAALAELARIEGRDTAPLRRFVDYAIGVARRARRDASRARGAMPATPPVVSDPRARASEAALAALLHAIHAECGIEIARGDPATERESAEGRLCYTTRFDAAELHGDLEPSRTRVREIVGDLPLPRARLAGMACFHRLAGERCGWPGAIADAVIRYFASIVFVQERPTEEKSTPAFREQCDALADYLLARTGADSLRRRGARALERREADPILLVDALVSQVVQLREGLDGWAAGDPVRQEMVGLFLAELVRSIRVCHLPSIRDRAGLSGYLREATESSMSKPAFVLLCAGAGLSTGELAGSEDAVRRLHLCMRLANDLFSREREKVEGPAELRRNLTEIVRTADMDEGSAMLVVAEAYDRVHASYRVARQRRLSAGARPELFDLLELMNDAPLFIWSRAASAATRASRLDDFLSYWSAHRLDEGRCDYSTACLARARRPDGGLLFPELTPRLLELLDGDGAPRRRTSLPTHDALVAAAVHNALVGGPRAADAGEVAAGARRFVAAIACALDRPQTPLVHVDLTLSRELTLLLAHGGDLRPEETDELARVRDHFAKAASRRLAAHPPGSFLAQHPQTAFGFEALPGAYQSVPIAAQLFARFGSIACNPAATAGYLQRTSDPRAAEYLRSSLRAAGWAHAMPTYGATNFVRCWVLGNLAKGGVDLRAHLPGELRALGDALTAEGLGAGAALPPDADDSAMALHVLDEHTDDSHDPSFLRRWWSDDAQAYGTFQKANTHEPDVSVNARVALAFFTAKAGAPGGKQRAWRELVAFLERTLVRDGSGGVHWTDRWNISPLYPTHEIVYVLSRFHREHAAARPTDLHHRAVDWILRSQAEDGSIRAVPDDGAALEETSYGLLALKWYARCCGPDLSAERRRAVLAAIEAAQASVDGFDLQDPIAGLWVGKALYEPRSIVFAAATAASMLGW